MLRYGWTNPRPQVAGNANLDGNLPSRQCFHQFWILAGGEPVTDPLGWQVECAPHRSRPGTFASVRGKPKAIFRGIRIHIAKQFGSGLALVSANSESGHARAFVAHAELGHSLCLLRAELAHCIKDPEQRDPKVAFPTFPAAFHSGEDRIKILLTPE